MIGPLPFLAGWLTGLLSLGLVAAAVIFGWEWQDDLVREEWKLWVALALSALAFLGRPLVLMLLPGERQPPHPKRDGERRRVMGADGAELEVETVGPAGAPALVFTHGWGLEGTVWEDYKHGLTDRFRVVTWDLPGLGRSTRARGGEETLEVFADSLAAVVAATGGPVVLVGHSIGGMTIQTLARRHPQLLGTTVKGLALVHTTYTAPDRTMFGRKVFTALREPLIVPLMRVSVLLSPLLWLNNWMSWLNGTMHIAHRLLGFGRRATRRRVDISATLAAKGSPAVQARGNIAMLHWDATEVAAALDLPVLVFTGGRDLITQPDAGADIAGRAPNARLAAMADTGHMGFFERPDDYAREIGAFADAALAPQARS